MKTDSQLYAVMVLSAFCSCAVGQAAAPPAVSLFTYQIGEWNRTIPGSRDLLSSPHTFTVTAPPGIICGLESAVTVKSVIQRHEQAGTLRAYFDAAEKFGTATPAAIRQSLFAFLDYSPGKLSPDQLAFASASRTLSLSDVAYDWNAGRAMVLAYANSCLSEADAKQFVLQLRQIIRAYLGLPPPQ